MMASKEILAVYLDEKFHREVGMYDFSIDDILEQYAIWGDLIINTPVEGRLCQLYMDNRSALYGISIALSIIGREADFSNEHQGSWGNQYSLFTQVIAEKLLSGNGLSTFEHDMRIVTHSRFLAPLQDKIGGIGLPPSLDSYV